MAENSNHSVNIIGFIIFLWLILFAMYSSQGELCCSVCTPIVIFVTFFGLLSIRKEKGTRMFAAKDTWPDDWTLLTVILIFMIWLVFGILANSVVNGTFESQSYDQDELAERMSTICLPICLLATIVLVALEIKHARKSRKRPESYTYKFDDNMSRAERLQILERGLNRIGSSTAEIFDDLDLEKDAIEEDEPLLFCPHCGGKVTVVERSGRSYCGRCKKYV